MALHRRKLLQTATAAAAACAIARSGFALDYPARPVRIIDGFPAGVSSDVVARLVAQQLSERFGAQFFVENRPGAGGNLGTEAVVRAAPDGYTLLLSLLSNVVNVTLYPTLNFSFTRNLAPVAFIGVTPYVMVVNPAFPAQTVPEFIAYAKANPGKINMASAGIGTASHVFGELFKMMADVNLLHVPYRDSVMPDLLSGQVQVAFNPVPTQIVYFQSGTLRPLAVTTTARLDMLPNVPAMSEFVPGYEANSWSGLCAPKGTPAAIVEKLNSGVNAVTTDPQIRGRLLALGVVPMPKTPAEFGQLIAADTEKWAKVIKFAGIKAE